MLPSDLLLPFHHTISSSQDTYRGVQNLVQHSASVVKPSKASPVVLTNTFGFPTKLEVLLIIAGDTSECVSMAAKCLAELRLPEEQLGEAGTFPLVSL